MSRKHKTDHTFDTSPLYDSIFLTLQKLYPIVPLVSTSTSRKAESNEVLTTTEIEYAANMYLPQIDTKYNSNRKSFTHVFDCKTVLPRYFAFICQCSKLAYSQCNEISSRGLRKVETLDNIICPLPPLEIQQRIVDQLSVIENSAEILSTTVI